MSSINLSTYNHRSEIHIFGLNQLKIKKEKSAISDRDVIRFDWIDQHDKPCSCVFFLDEKAVKGSIQATPEIRKLVATAA